MSEIELTPFEQHEREFLESPDVPALLKLYEFLLDEVQDHELAGILDKIRPIQHRVTLIQADASPELLEALCRDPHRDVRSVVATHANISDEVCFRLCEDPERSVRLALRKNEACHPVIRAALLLREKPGEANRVRALQLLEVAWQARRLKLEPKELVELIEEWTFLEPEDYESLDTDQIRLLLQVLGAKLGQGSMPRKPRRPAKGGKKSGRAKRVSARSPKVSARVKTAAPKKKTAKKKTASKKAAKKKTASKKATKKKTAKKKTASKKATKKKAAPRRKR